MDVPRLPIRKESGVETTPAKIPAVLLLQVLATVFMTGVIWYVQLVHYPLMAGWPHDDFPRWEAAIVSRRGWSWCQPCSRKVWRWW